MATSLRCFILLAVASHPIWSADEKSREQFVWLNSGDSFTLQCSTTNTDYDGLYLHLGLSDEKEVFFLYEETDKLTTTKEYSSRMLREGPVNNLKITLVNMTEDDSGVYWCKYRRKDTDDTRTRERFTGNGSAMVVVNGKPCPKNNGVTLTSNLVMVSAISAASVFLLCIIVLILWLVPRMKSMRKSRVHARRSDSIYEDMRKNHQPHRGRQSTQPTNHFP